MLPEYLCFNFVTFRDLIFILIISHVHSSNAFLYDGDSSNSAGSFSGARIQQFKYRDCAAFPSDAVKVNEIKITPDFKVTASVDVLKHLSGPLSVDFVVMKKMRFLGWTKIPCFGGKYGSCKFRDVCTLAPKYITKCLKVAESTPTGLPCSCPINAKTYNVVNLQIDPKERRYMPSWMTSGEFAVTATVRANGRDIGCHNFNTTIA